MRDTTQTRTSRGPKVRRGGLDISATADLRPVRHKAHLGQANARESLQGTCSHFPSRAIRVIRGQMERNAMTNLHLHHLGSPTPCN